MLRNKGALIVTTQFPFPPRNGITIPTANYIRLLVELGYIVDLLIVGSDDGVKESSLLRKIMYHPYKRNMPLSILKELLQFSPHCCNFSVNNMLIRDVAYQTEYKLILSSPLSVTKIANGISKAICDGGGYKPLTIAAISDCYTEELRNVVALDRKMGISLKSIARNRARYMGRLEERVLKYSSKVFVQSEYDMAKLGELGKGSLSQKIEVLTNGVDDALFDIHIEKKSSAKNFCYIANFSSPDYSHKLLWLYDNVWKKLDIEGGKLLLYGKGIEENDPKFRIIINDSSVIYKKDYISDLRDIYRNIDVLFAPVFRKHGYINKVGEALASGVVVIGDITAFGAIPNFKSNTHGIVANTGDEMILEAEGISRSAERFHGFRLRGRELALECLQWHSRSSAFE